MSKLLLFLPVFLCLSTTMPILAQQIGDPNKGVVSSKIKVVEKVYKKTDHGDLSLTMYFPPNWDKKELHPAMVFFFDGNWEKGEEEHFEPHSSYFSTRGMLSITVDYRVAHKHNVSPVVALTDAKSAIRWVRKNAKKFGVDPEKIAVCGGALGGFLAAASATIKDYDATDEDLTISSSPNAVILFNPLLNLNRSDELKLSFKEHSYTASPLNNVRQGMPPFLIFHGTKDKVVPYDEARAFQKQMNDNGNSCELVPFEGDEHAFFYYHVKHGYNYRRSIVMTDIFLNTHGFLEGEPLLK